MMAATFLALVVGAAVGMFLPDVDRVFPFLFHRSFVTHSPLLPLLAYWLVRENPKTWQRWGLIGLVSAMTVHLAFDLFPRAWYGFALIHVTPFIELNPTLSAFWLLGSMVACAYLALVLVARRRELGMALACLVVVFLLSAFRNQVLILPALALLLACGLATFLPNKLVNGPDLMRRVISQPARPAPGSSGNGLRSAKARQEREGD